MCTSKRHLRGAVSDSFQKFFQELILGTSVWEVDTVPSFRHLHELHIVLFLFLIRIMPKLTSG